MGTSSIDHNTMKGSASVVLLLAAAVSAQIPNLGWCPDYLPMADFDVNSFLGKWYEQERYFTFSEVASRCVVTDYAKAPSGRIYVSNEVTNRLWVELLMGVFLGWFSFSESKIFVFILQLSPNCTLKGKCVFFLCSTGVKRIIGGNLELIGKVGEGKLNVKYATTPIATEQTLTVLSTDYDEYAVIWSCSDFGPVNTREY